NYSSTFPVSGNPTTAGLIHTFGSQWSSVLTERYNSCHTQDKTIDQIIEDIWHALSSFNDEELLKQWVIRHYLASEVESTNFISIKPKKGYANLSLKAIRNILPYLRLGHIYTHAVFFAKLKDIIPNDIWQNTVTQNEILAKVGERIDSHPHYLKKIRAVNDLIEEYSAAYRSDIGEYQPADKFFKEKLESVTEPTPKWRKTYNRLNQEEKQEIENRFNVQITEYQMKFIKPLRIDERISEMLHKEYSIGEKQLSKLYHPSAIDTYPQAKIAEDGNFYLGSPRISTLKNPVVMRALHELKTLINYLIKTEQIDPDTRIHIELAREINSRNQRRAIELYQSDRQKLRKKYREEIADHYDQHRIRREVNDDDILKYELWKEQATKCYYCGADISVSQLLGDSKDVEIEHTIPLSQFFDDSMQNKTVCHTWCNREVKGGRMPGEMNEEI
ncbi:hypothetical protein DOJK_02314, partial [Patescibacteria group bacterium]